jgi:hypothetical protein
VKLVSISVDEEVNTKVYWSGVTKSGCAGQFTNCFRQDIGVKISYEILASENGGACVGVTSSDKKLIAKALPCETKLFLACQGEGVATISASVRILSYHFKFSIVIIVVWF